MFRSLTARSAAQRLGGAALAGAALALQVSLAAPGVQVELSPGSFELGGGESRTLTVKVTNAGLPARITLTVTAPTQLSGDVGVSSSDSSCSGSGSTVICSVDVFANSQKNVAFTLTAKSQVSVGAGQSRTDTTGAVSIGNGSTKLTYGVTLRGPSQGGSGSGGSGSGSGSGGQSTAVAEVSGTVVDSTTGDPLGGATVVLRDGAGTTFRGTADSAGGYRFTSSASQIKAGTLTVTASRDQYETAAKTVEAKAGQSYTGIQVKLRPGGASAGASPGASGSADPGVVTYSPGATVGARRDAGMDLVSKMLIWFGTSLLALVVGAVAILFIRRRLDRADAADGAADTIYARGVGGGGDGGGGVGGRGVGAGPGADPWASYDTGDQSVGTP